MMNKRLFFWLLFTPLLLVCGAINSQDNPELNESGIQVYHRVEKTALFPGDVISYQVEILCNADVDILTDDLAEDELILSGLELISSEFERELDNNYTRYRITYHLTTYETNISQLQIDELRVRYYFKRPGQRIENVATVGEVVVPAVSLILRSTLPDEIENLQLRDGDYLDIRSSWTDNAGVWGLVLILISVVPVGSYLVSYIQRRNQKIQSQKAAEAVQISVSQFDVLRELDANNIEQRRDGFRQLEAIIKDYLSITTGLAAHALTAGELSTHKRMIDSVSPLNDFTGVLTDCEFARYGKDDHLPGADDLLQGIALTERLVTSN